jgi:hypothetical protein
MVEPIRDEGQTLPYPTGKVLGVVDSQKEFDNVVAGLKNAGFPKITAVHGDEGVQLLERLEGFFWGDAEGPVLRRHIDELKRGAFIFAVQTPSSDAEKVAEVASQHGARFIVHFGFATVTWIKK